MVYNNTLIWFLVFALNMHLLLFHLWKMAYCVLKHQMTKFNHYIKITTLISPVGSVPS